MSSAVSFPLLRRIRDFHPLETCAARRMKKSRSRLFRARAVCEAYTSFPRGAHPRGAFYVIGISYHIMNRLSATGFALCDEQPGCPRSRFSPPITSPRLRALLPAFAGCSFSNGTRKTNAAFSVACFSFVLIIYQNRLEREYRKRYDFQADPNMVL